MDFLLELVELLVSSLELGFCLDDLTLDGPGVLCLRNFLFLEEFQHFVADKLQLLAQTHILLFETGHNFLVFDLRMHRVVQFVENLLFSFFR